MESLAVTPEALLDASRVFRSAAPVTVFDSSAGAEVGSSLAAAYTDFVRRVQRAGLTAELTALALVLEAAATTYELTEGDIARRASGHGD